jgi:hypothetical protein
MKLIIKITALIIFLFGAISCAPIPKPFTQIAPGISLPPDEVNSRLKLSTIQGITELKIRNLLNLDLVNISNTPIGFPSDFGVRVFIEEQNQWTEIKNIFGYASGNNIVVPLQFDKIADTIVPIYPVVTSSTQPAKIRVIVIGIVYQNSEPTSIKTAAFIDLVLQP